MSTTTAAVGAATAATPSTIRQGKVVLGIGILILIIGLVVVPLIGGPVARVRGIAFALSLLGVLGLFAAFGQAITGFWGGILMSGRNAYSLSRMQGVCWSWVVLSALAAAVACNLWNVGAPIAAPFNIDIPTNLLVVLGISGATVAAAPAALALRAATQPAKTQVDAARARLDEPSLGNTGQVVTRADAMRASWLDIIQGDEVSNAGVIDLSKVQQLLVTALLVVGYAVLVGRSFTRDFDQAGISGLPDFSGGFAWLVGISHGAYIAYKGAPKSAAGPDRVAASSDGRTDAAPPSP